MIRGAIMEDLGDVLSLAERMHAEAEDHKPMRFDADKVATMLASFINGRNGVLIVAEEKGQIIGAIAGYCVEGCFSRDLVVGEQGLFVVPEKRGGLTGARLLKAWIKWGRNTGAKHIFAAITTGVHVEQTERMYELVGGRRLGGVFEFSER